MPDLFNGPAGSPVVRRVCRLGRYIMAASDKALMEAVIALIDSKKDQEAREGRPFVLSSCLYDEINRCLTSWVLGPQFSKKLTQAQ